MGPDFHLSPRMRFTFRLLPYCSSLLVLFACQSGSEVHQAPVPIFQAQPKYPTLDWDATPPPPVLKASVLVDTSGRIAEISWLEGAEVLQQQAEISLLKWRFEPANQGGDAIEERYEIALNMEPPETLSRRPAPIPKLLHRVQPTFPHLRKTDEINRQEAVMRISIDKKGRVKEAKWVSGPEALKVAYLAAVKTWQYESVNIPNGHTFYVFDQPLVYRFD